MKTSRLLKTDKSKSRAGGVEGVIGVSVCENKNMSCVRSTWQAGSKSTQKNQLTKTGGSLVRLVTTGRGRPGSLIVVELWVVATVLRGKGGRGTGSGHSNGHAVVSVGRSFLAAGAAARAWATTKVCRKIQAHLGQGGRFVGRRTGWCQFGRRGNCSRRRGGGVYNRIFAAG